MPDYKKMYTTLFNAVTDAIEILQSAQQDTEELFIETETAVIKILPSDKIIPPNAAPSDSSKD